MKSKKVISFLITLVLVISMCPVIAFADGSTVTGTFDVVVEVLEWGSAVTSVVIDLGDGNTAAEVDLAVSAVVLNPVNNAETYNGPRNITNVAVDGQYITLELDYGNLVPASHAVIYTGSRNFWRILNYAVTGTIDGKTLAATQDEIIHPIYDDFILTQNPVDGYTTQNYRVYTPEGVSGPLPLVLWNHGAGETYGVSSGVGNEGSQLFGNMGGIGWVLNGPENAIVIAPQRDRGGAGAPGYSDAGVAAYIRYLIEEGKVDADRVYVSGCSAGGAETHTYMVNYPDLWAAAIPICPASTLSVAQAETVAAGGFPVWYVHDTYDNTVNIASSRNSAQRLAAANPDGNYLVTEINGVRGLELPNAENPDFVYATHWSWVPVLNNHDFIDYDVDRGPIMNWLYALTKGDPVEPSTNLTVSLSGASAVETGAEAEYILSAANMNKLATVTAWFEVNGTYFSGKAVEGLNGFSTLGDIAWESTGGSLWTGRVTLTNMEGGVTSQPALDIFKLTLAVQEELGASDVKLTRIVLSGYDENNTAVFMEADLGNDSVTTEVLQYFAPYDLNRDGAVDQLDLTVAQLYYAAREGDANWSDAKIADVNGDGRVDIEDLILILNNIVW